MLAGHERALAQSMLFKGIEQAELAHMLKCLSPRVSTFGRNEYIANAGDPFHALGIILKGTAAVYKENPAGNRVVMTVLSPPDMFGEVIAFSKASLWPVSVEALEACDVFFLHRDRIVGDCNKMCPWHKLLITNMLSIVSEKALHLNRQVEYFSIKSMRGKLSAYLLDQSRRAGSLTFSLPLNRNKLAEYLSVSRPSMSRELARLKAEGVIDFHLQSVRILDMDALKESLS